QTNRIYNLDCQTALPFVDSDSVRLTVTSPPYDETFSFGGNDATTIDFALVAKELFRLTLPGGVVCWQYRDQRQGCHLTTTKHRQVLTFVDAGFWLYDEIALVKEWRSTPPQRRYGPIEFVYVFSKGRPAYVNLIQDRPNKSFGMPLNATFRRKEGK